MATRQDVVLVSVPEKTTRKMLTSALRDKWPVRTAATAEQTDNSLDDSIAVVIVDDDPTLAGSVMSVRDDNATAPELLWIGSPDCEGAELADAVLQTPVQDQRLRSAVQRLQRRARYDRLLTEFYARASSQAESDSASAASDAAADDATELAALKRELDDLATALDIEDAFEVALRK